jgi:hypothetical protein
MPSVGEDRAREARQARRNFASAEYLEAFADKNGQAAKTEAAEAALAAQGST